MLAAQAATRRSVAVTRAPSRVALRSPPSHRREGAEHPSYNSAKKALEFTVAILRAELRPRYGDGFAGAPIGQRRLERTDDLPIEGGDDDQFGVGYKPHMLGTISAVESLMKEDKITPPRRGRQRPVLVVHATFEEGRLAATCLVTAYEQAVPVTRRRTTAARSSASCDHAARPRVERKG